MRAGCPWEVVILPLSQPMCGLARPARQGGGDLFLRRHRSLPLLWNGPKADGMIALTPLNFIGRTCRRTLAWNCD